ncbi:hypothetical protein [Parabacteroides sp. AM08-6]|uniref:hypothetical protein n=1 Tax=Parabacteroides sp. AM08-6 TaxID=2292053 RepID=UPI000EFE2D7D|nr:hypothetical protein [Parabacteroides sp. AM08-6]RHJ81889.1 hypothetical protein DW103_10480 [Parabacteroides sp. AM08-6]
MKNTKHEKHVLPPPSLKTLHLNGLLLGDQAAECLYHLIAGERGSRNYVFSKFNEYGYFYEPFIRRWIVFDNRAGDCYVEVCDTDKQAAKILEDGEQLLAA